MRAPPMPTLVAVALAWFFVRMNKLGGAFLILAGYDCFLRTGEMLSLIISDVVLGQDNRGIIRLGHTKSGRRHASFEASAFNDPMCGQMFRAFLKSLPPNTHEEHYIFLPRVNQFYKHFKAGLKWLGLESYGFQPYSIRRGGATAYFRTTRNMEATLDRGRWSSSRVARIYLNDGLGKEIELRIPEEILRRLQTCAGALRLWLNSL